MVLHSPPGRSRSSSTSSINQEVRATQAGILRPPVLGLRPNEQPPSATVTEQSTAVTQAKPASVQTGLDRYGITLDKKRKLSPQASDSDKLAKKSQISSEDANQVPYSGKNNSFGSLSQPDEAPKTTGASKKPVPIYLREQSSNALVKEITKLVGKNNFHIVPITRGTIKETKLQAYNESGYRAISKYLSDNFKKFYTFQLKSSKGLQVVIKGIEPFVEVDEIKEALAEKGFKVKTIVNIFNKNKVPQPMFKVELSPDSCKLKKGETHPIHSLQYLLHRRITVEAPHKRNDPVQCLNCQEFGHTRTYCTLPTVCVVCGDLHGLSDCKIIKTDLNAVKKCSNCGENHTANYRGCPVYKVLKNKLQQKISIKKTEVSHNVPTNSRFVTSNMSYANILKQNTQGRQNLDSLQQDQGDESPIKTNSIEAMIASLTQCMTQFMSSMQQMVQNLITSQNQMIQVLLSKK